MSDSEDYSEPDAIIIDREDVSNYNPDQILPKSTEDIKTIRKWLEPTSYAIAGGEFRKHLSSHAPGTGRWLTSTEEYQQWLHLEERGLLWIKGIPGSGKSVHVAKLIDDLRKTNPGCPVLFFFFRQIITANHSPQALLRDWMDQVLLYSPPLQHQLWSYIKDEVRLGSLSTSDLLKDLQMAFRALPDRVFCVADALDEMDTGNDAFLQALGSLGQWRPSKVKVLITSRPVPRVETPLRQIPVLSIRLEERLVDVDISTYVHSKLFESQIPQSKWSVIANAVPGRANGLFLYAKLAMEAFLEPGADIEAVLAHLPADLNVLYTDLLQDHSRRSGISPSIQHKILQSVTHATRPLRLVELAEMCRVIDFAGSDKDLKAMKELIRTACGPLLEILPDETVSVVHHSFTEYLKGTTRSENEGGYEVLRPGPTHAELAMSSLRYMLVTGCLDEVKTWIDDNDDSPAYSDEIIPYSPSKKDVPFSKRQEWVPEDILELRLKFPFLVYATRNWHIHVRRAEEAPYPQEEISELIEQFLSVDKTVKAWHEVTWPGFASNARKFSILHLAARYGLVSYTKKLLASWPGEVDAYDISRRTALWWAASKGHAAIVSQLIAAGARPDLSERYNGRRPLHEAATKNHDAVVTVLLEAGVDPLTPVDLTDYEKETNNLGEGCAKPALAFACEHGNVEAVRAFLPLIDVEAVHHGLAWAAQTGQAQVVKLILLQPGLDVDTIVRGSTALFKTCSRRDLASVKALLGAGANPNVLNDVWKEEFGSSETSETKALCDLPTQLTCLHAVCGVPGLLGTPDDWDDHDCCEMAALLIEAGADVHCRTVDGATALHYAVQRSHSLAATLIEAGASAHAIDSQGQTPLYYCRVPACVPLLVEQGGADVNFRDGHGDTPLLAALAEPNEKPNALVFLQYGADADALTARGDNSLHVALKSNHATADIVQTLLDKGVKPDARDCQGKTALMYAWRSLDAEKICELLLAAGADINARDRSGHTVFWHQASQRPERKGSGDGTPHDDFRFLLNRGALPGLRDFEGRTCLHEAIKKQKGDEETRDTPCFDFLLSIGLDHTVVDYNGNSLLHELAATEAAETSSDLKWVPSLWERLVCTLDMDVDQQNYHGRTPLHVLCDAFPQTAIRYVDAPEPMDFIIARMKNIDVPDHAGFTALHIASTRTEFCTKKLLEAGADPQAVTHQGLTPLHLAARAQESNIVGILVRHLQQSSSQDSPTQGLDAKDANGLSPLYHAVRSGRPETVNILLKAGANVKTGGDLFQACSEFEDESTLRHAAFHVKHDPLTQREVRTDDLIKQTEPSPIHPVMAEFSPGETRRLEEIVTQLVSFNADTTGLRSTEQPSKRGIIEECMWKGKAYTARCLADRVARDLWLGPDMSAPNLDVFAISGPTYHRHMTSSDRFPEVVPGTQSTYSFRLFLRQRQYRLVQELVKRGARSLPDPYDENPSSDFAFLIRHGYTSLVKRIGRIEAKRALEQGDWHAFGDSSQAGLWFAKRPENELRWLGGMAVATKSIVERIPKPFLLEAVQRDLPNLEIVKMLVEDFYVDVNERLWTVDDSGHVKVLAYADSALHYVAQGLNWWHVHQALRYLLKVPGINTNLQIMGGRTPLHMAISGATTSGPRPHAYDAAKRLLRAGADVHAVTDKKESCLSLAKDDVQMTRLLIEHGAIISPHDVVAAVKAGRLEVLHELLHAKDKEGGRSELDLNLALQVAGGLFHKVTPDEDVWRQTIDDAVIIHMIGVLIEHGANPLGHYLKWEQGVVPDPQMWYIHFKKGPAPRVETDDPHAVYEEKVLLHELILDVDRIEVEPFLVPGLDVNYRNMDGLTLLHAACIRADLIGKPCHPQGSLAMDGGQSGTLFQSLVALGADINARDKQDRSPLLCLLNGALLRYERDLKGWTEVLDDIIRQAPELVHLADDDGDTPLIYATRLAANSKGTDIDMYAVRRLLSAGADPLATNKRSENVLHKLAKDLGTPALRQLCRELVGAGADINGRDELGQTPLFKFAYRYRQDTDNQFSPDWSWKVIRGELYEEPREQGAIAVLQKLGADFFATDDEGRGLLHIAATQDAVRFQELMAAGLDPTAENYAQQTAIDAAAACSNDYVLEIFEKKAKR